MNPSRIISSIKNNLMLELQRMQDVLEYIKTEDTECETDEFGYVDDAIGYLTDSISECNSYLISNPTEEDVPY